MSFYNYINFHVARLTKRYVGQYLEGIQPEKFELAWKKGNLQLSDVRIRPEVVDLINLPVSLVCGWIGSVNISLPFRSLLNVGLTSSESLLIEIKELFMVLVPKHGDEWGEEALTRRYHLMRQRRLDRCDVKLLAEHAKNCMVESIRETASAQSGWMARLAARIVADVKIRITTVHIRYESFQSEISKSFSAGVTLETMEIDTPRDQGLINSLQKNSTLDSQSSQPSNTNSFIELASDVAEDNGIFSFNLNDDEFSHKRKRFRITRIATYWNNGRDSLFFSFFGFSNKYKPVCSDHEHKKDLLRKMVFFPEASDQVTDTSLSKSRSSSVEFPNLSFVLKPFTCSFLLLFSTMLPFERKVLHVHTSNPDSEALRSRISSTLGVNIYKLWVELASLNIVLNQDTLRGLAQVINTIHLYNSLLTSVSARMELYAPYRPEISITSSPRIWWKYAVGCIVRRLRCSFPGAFNSKPSIFSWGESLKQARVASWRAEYRHLLRSMLDKTVLSSGGNHDAPKCSAEDAEKLQLIQERLPEKDLLEVFVETKREYLASTGNQNCSDFKRESEEINQSRNFFSSWYMWLKPKQEPSKKDKTFPDPDLSQKSSVISEENDSDFYDIEDILSNDDGLDVFHDLTCTDRDFSSAYDGRKQTGSDHLRNRHETLEKVDVVRHTLKEDPGPWKFFPQQKEEEKQEEKEDEKEKAEDISEVVRGLLEADKTIVDVFVELEAASMQVELSTFSRFYGTITNVRVRVQNNDAFSQYITIQDYCLQYSLFNSTPRALLARREGLSKELLSFQFCSKHPLYKVPLVVLDVKEVIIHWIPSFLHDITIALSLFRQSDSSLTEFQELADNLGHLNYSSRLVSFEKLSAAKKLMCKEYRSSVIKISVEAPTFIFPASHINEMLNRESHSSVITVHLGALSINSENFPLVAAQRKSDDSCRSVGANFAQIFRVNLREFYMECVENYSISKDSSKETGQPIISPFAVEFHVSLAVVKKKTMSFASSSYPLSYPPPYPPHSPLFSAPIPPPTSRPILAPCSPPPSPDMNSKYSMRDLKQDPLFPVVPSNKMLNVSTTLCNRIEIHGDLPALKMTLNRRIHCGMMAAFRLATQSYKSPKDTAFSVENISHGQDTFSSTLRVQSNNLSYINITEENPFIDTSLSFNDSIHQIGKAKSLGAVSKSQYLFNTKNSFLVKSDTQNSSLVTLPQKKLDSSLCVECAELIKPPCAAEFTSLDTLPMEINASFSLQTFVMAVDCSNTLSEVVTLVTDRTIVTYHQEEFDQKTAQFKMGQITIFREKQDPSSPYYYLLKTSDVELNEKCVTGVNGHSTKKTDISSDNDVSNFLIFIQILFSPASTQTNHVPLFISIEFLRHMKLFFHPRVLRSFLQFWSGTDLLTSSESFHDLRKGVQTVSKDLIYEHSFSDRPDFQSNTAPGDTVLPCEYQSQRVATGLHCNQSAKHTTGDMQRKNALIWQLKLSVLIVSCVCIDSNWDTPHQKVFALCTFEDASMNLKSYKSGVSLFIELKNLMIEDFHSESLLMDLVAGKNISQSNHLVTLFRVLPDGGSLVCIHVKTTDKQFFQFDGISLILDMEIGKVEIVCVVEKLLRFFNWIVNSFLETFRSGSCPPSIPQEAPSFLHHSLSVQEIRKNLVVDQIDFVNSGQRILLEWMLKALDCDPSVGCAEIYYLASVFNYQYKTHVKSTSNIPVCPLTLRKYNITICEPTLVFPVTLPYSSRKCILTVSSITITNAVCVEKKYGLVDNLKFILNNVAIRNAVNNQFLVTNVTITVHFLRSLLTCCPPNPTRMTFGFSDLAIFLDPISLRCLIDIVQYNILGGNHNDSSHYAPSNHHDASSRYDSSIHQDLSSHHDFSIHQDLSSHQHPSSHDTLLCHQDLSCHQNFSGHQDLSCHRNSSSHHDPSRHYDLSSHRDSSKHYSPSNHHDFSSHYDLSGHRDPSCHQDLSSHHDPSHHCDFSNHHDLSSHCNLSGHRDPSGHWSKDSVVKDSDKRHSVSKDVLSNHAPGNLCESSPLILTSSFEFTFPNTYIFLSCENNLDQTHAISLIFRADLVQCSITKNIQQVVVLDVGALSARMFYCGLLSSPFSLFLSDSHENLIDCFKENLLDLRHFSTKLKKNVKLASNFFQYINQSASFEINSSFDISCETKRSKTAADRIHCVYTSRAGVLKKLSIAVYDPRLILIRETLDSICKFFKNLQQAGHSYESGGLKNSHHTETSLSYGESLTLDVELVRACILTMESPECVSRVLAMRGHFRGQRHTVLDLSETPSNISVAHRAQVQHHNLDISNVELFITDLNTLSAVEVAQQQYLLQQKKSRMSSDLEHIKGVPASYENSFVPLGYILGLPADFYSTPLDSKGEHKSRSLFSLINLKTKKIPSSAKVDNILFSSPNWNDLIRFLCPQLEITIHSTNRGGTLPKSKQSVLSIVVEVHPLRLEVSYSDLKFLEGCLIPWISGVTSSGDLKNVESLNSLQYHVDSSFGTAMDFPEDTSTQVTIDITEVALVLCNDLEEYASAPFLHLSAFNGTFSGWIKQSTCLRSMVFDLTLSLILQFFNPRAVAYEPILENLLVSGQWQKNDFLSTLPQSTEFGEVAQKVSLSFSGLKKSTLCVNLSDIFLSVCTKNYIRWKIIQSEAENDMCRDSGTHSFRFAPYTLKNNSGIPLIVLPFQEKTQETENLVHQCQNIATDEQAANWPTYEVVLPDSTTRLSQFRLDVEKSFNQALRTLSKLRLLFGSSGSFTLAKGISVDRLGVTVLPLIPRTKEYGVPFVKLNSNLAEYKMGEAIETSGNYIISRVAVSEGQKRLTIESQILLEVAFASMWGLEVQMKSEILPYGETKLLEPLSKSALPALQCSDQFTTLSFRPLSSRRCLHEPVKYEPLYDWSDPLSIASIWRKIEIIEMEQQQTSDDISPLTSNNGASWLPSSLPLFLPVQNFSCLRSASARDALGEAGDEVFYFCLSVRWENHVYQDMRCRQITLTFYPSFRLRSVVPIPLRYTVSSDFKSTSKHLPRITGLQYAQVTGTIRLHEDIVFHSLPFLERIALGLSIVKEESHTLFIQNDFPRKNIIYQRDYPIESLLLDGSEPNQWKYAWIREAKGLQDFHKTRKQIVLDVCSYEQPYRAAFSLYALFKGSPDQPLSIVLYSPNWIISHITPSLYFRKSYLDCNVAVRFATEESSCVPMTEQKFDSVTSLGYGDSLVASGLDESCHLKYFCGIAHESNDNRSSVETSQEQSTQLERRLCDAVDEPWCCPLDVRARYIGLEFVDIYHSSVGGCSEFINLDESDTDRTRYMELSSFYTPQAVAEIALRVSQPLSLYGFPVAQLTLMHRFYLVNLTDMPLMYRQEGTTTSFFLEPNGKLIPLEWVEKDQLRVFNLKRAGNMWQWGGRLCPRTLCLGEGFLYHLAPDNWYTLNECDPNACVRLEKRRVEWNHGVYTVVLVLQNCSTVLSHEGFWILNNCAFPISLWQHQTPVTRAFSVKAHGGSCHFSWDDMLVAKSIYVIPEANDCSVGMVINPDELSFTDRQLLRFGDTWYGTKHWCFLVISRENGRRFLTFSNYSSPQKASRDKKHIHYASVPTKVFRAVFKQNICYCLEITVPSVCFSFICDLSDRRSLVTSKFLRKRNAQVDPQLWNRLKLLVTSKSKAPPTVPQEFICIYLLDLNILFCVRSLEKFLSMTILDVQIDNCDSNAIFPVVLQPLGIPSSTTLQHFESYQLTEGVSLAVNLNEQPLVDVVLIQGSDSYGYEQFSYMKFLRVIVLGLSLKADMDFVATLSEFVKRWKECLQVSESIAYGQRKDDLNDVKKLLESAESMTLQQTQQENASFYIKEFVFHPILLRASFSPVTLSSSSGNNQTNFLVKGFLIRFLSSIGSFQDLPIRFSPLKLEDIVSNIYSLYNMLKSFYLTQLWASALTVAGNMDFLGNPVSTLSHLGAGLGDLVAEPVRALHNKKETSLQPDNSTNTVLHGFSKGAKSFWDNTVYGAFNVVSKVSGVAAQGLGVLALDEAYAKEKRHLGARRQPRDAAEGLSMGAEAFGKAVVGGLKGLVAEPAKAIEMRGLEGLAEGVGRGVVGALVKPVAGIFEMASLTAGGIQEAAGESSGVARGRRSRKRPPRVFYGSDRVIRYYSYTDAKLNNILLYTPELYWDVFRIECLIYDEYRNYIWVITSEELCTIIMKQGKPPKIHVYCMLWQIQECQAVARFAFSRAHSKVQRDSAQGIASLPYRSKAEHRYIESTLSDLLNKAHDNEEFYGGIVLGLRDPLPNRYINTSSMSIALKISKRINDVICQL